MCSFLRK